MRWKILIVIFLSGAWLVGFSDDPEYYLQAEGCAVYKRPSVQLSYFKLSRSECSMMKLDGRSGIISVALDVRTGRVVPPRRKSNEIRILLDIKGTRGSSHKRGERYITAFSEPDYPDSNPKSFVYKGVDSELVTVLSYASGWGARRQYKNKELRYFYEYNVAPVRYVDLLVVSFLERMN